MSWDITRRQIRTLETRLDAALNQYSRVAANLTSSGVSSGGTKTPWPGQEVEEGRTNVAANEDLERSIESMLAEHAAATSKLASILDDPTIPASASQQHTLQRHREVLLDFERDYRRSRTNVKQALDRRNLLGSVKIDIDNYKARQGGDTDALLAERSRLDNSHRMIDGTLDQAYATRADINNQRSTLLDATTRLTHTANQIPGLNNLIRLISRRRQRDRVIMGTVVGACTVLLLMYITR